MLRKGRRKARNGESPRPFYVDPQTTLNRYGQGYVPTSLADRLYRGMRLLFGRTRKAK